MSAGSLGWTVHHWQTVFGQWTTCCVLQIQKHTNMAVSLALWNEFWCVCQEMMDVHSGCHHLCVYFGISCILNVWGTWIVAFREGDTGSVPGQSMCGLWWTKWHWGRFFSKYFGCLMPVSPICALCSYFIHILSAVCVTSSWQGH